MFVRSRVKGSARESGQVVVLFAILLPVLFGLGAIVLDIGNWYVHKRHLQTQVDAAALAAASGFSGCFFDPTSANLAIASTALSYAGDTARDPSSINLQVESPGSVRVTLNSQRYWAAGDPATPTTTGYGTTDPTVGDNSAGTPCATSTLDVKATDVDVPRLFSWLGIRPDIKAHARVEIHPVKEESGFLPLAVPEIDPNYVYAIFVDYTKDGTQTPLLVQELKKDSASFPSTFPYSGWIPKTESEVPGNTKVTLPPNGATGVVILVSKSDVAPSTSTGRSTRSATRLRRISSSATRGRAPPATTVPRSDRASPSSTAPRRAVPSLAAARAARRASRHGMQRPPQPGNLSGPYYINDDTDCTVGVTADVDFGVADDARERRSEEEAEPGRLLRGRRRPQLEAWQHERKRISTWTGTMSVPVVGGPQVLTLGWVGQALRLRTATAPSAAGLRPAAMAYGTDDNSGPVGYVKLEASGPNGSTTVPGRGDAVSDANSIPRGNYCYSVKVGLDEPLALKDAT